MLTVFLMVSTVPYYFLLNLALKEGLQLLLISFIGVSCSSMLGSIIGVVAKSQIVVGTISSPVSMIIGLLPMMSNFSSDLKKASDYLYSQRIYDFIYSFRVDTVNITSKDFIIFGCNFVAFALLFMIVYRKKGLALEK